MVKIMGYFYNREDVEESLEHSSGCWKTHKYIQKIGEGAKAKYKYAKEKVTGESYKKEAMEQKIKSDISKETGDNNGAAYHGRKASEAMNNYSKKSVRGISETTVNKGKNFLNNFFKSTTKVTVETDTVPKGDTVNLKSAKVDTLKKNKLSIKK